MPDPINVQDLYKVEGEALFANLYRAHKNAFISWASSSFSCNDQDALEIFQESMVALYQKIETGELVEVNASLKTYLFAIGKNLMRKQFDRSKRHKTDLGDGPEIAVDPISRQTDLDDRQLRLQAAIQQLGETCQKVIDLFYYRNYAIESIMLEMQFNSEEVVRSKKYKCIKQLEKLLHSS